MKNYIFPAFLFFFAVFFLSSVSCGSGSAGKRGDADLDLIVENYDEEIALEEIAADETPIEEPAEEYAEIEEEAEEPAEEETIPELETEPYEEETESEAEAEQALEWIQAYAISGHNIVIKWAPLESGSVVKIKRNSDVHPAFEEIAQKAGDHGRFLDLSLMPEIKYQYILTVCRGDVCEKGMRTDPIITPKSELPEINLQVHPNGTDDDLALMGVVTNYGVATIAGQIAALDRNGKVVWEYYSAERGVVTEIQPMPDHTLAVGEMYWLYVLGLDGQNLFQYTGKMAHHDIDRMSDGRFIFLYFDQFESAQNSGYWILGDGIAILSGDRSTVDWFWLARDHIPLSDMNVIDMQVDLFGLGHDWTHFNAIYFNEKESAIYANCRNLNRIYKINYPSGAVEWTLGDGGDFGDGLFAHAHDPEWTADNRFLIYDNGFQRPGGRLFTRVIEVEYDPAAKTAEIVWEYVVNPLMMATALGSAQLLTNGNIFITDGINGRIMEVTRDKEKVWEIQLPAGYYVYKAMTISRDFFENW